MCGIDLGTLRPAWGLFMQIATPRDPGLRPGLAQVGPLGHSLLDVIPLSLTSPRSLNSLRRVPVIGTPYSNADQTTTAPPLETHSPALAPAWRLGPGCSAASVPLRSAGRPAPRCWRFRPRA